MATFRKIPDRIEAWQWPAAHPMALPAGPGGQGLLAHSGEKLAPGDWIVNDHGHVSVWTDKQFRETFEPHEGWGED